MGPKSTTIITLLGCKDITVPRTKFSLNLQVIYYMFCNHTVDFIFASSNISSNEIRFFIWSRMRFILHRFYLLIIILIKETGKLKLFYIVYRLP